MKPQHVFRFRISILSAFGGVLCLVQPLQAQFIVTDVSNVHAQADYVVIAPPAFTGVMQGFAVHRSTYSNLKVVIVTTDAIYQTFGQGVNPDSAIREFVTYALTSWATPKPQYFLLAGNVNTVPSHREGPLIPGYEDSVMVDQWFVEGVPDQASFRRPAAAIGRLPGWDAAEMSVLVGKIIQYDHSNGSDWRSRSLCVADYDTSVGSLFEDSARQLQSKLAPRWADTITVHIRPSSPLYTTREQFRSAWKNGAAITTFMGFVNATTFSEERYFTTSDVDSLPDTSPLSMVRLLGGQRFQKHDTLCLAAKLMLADGKGAICTLAPSGAAWLSSVQDFMERVAERLASSPTSSLGRVILDVKRADLDVQGHSRETLLGDPALVIKNPLLADVDTGREIPMAFALHQNFPNPFNPTTQIAFDLPVGGVVALTLYNLLGQEIGTLVSGSLQAGMHIYTLNADDFRLGTGVYFYTLSSGNLIQTRKMLLIR